MGRKHIHASALPASPTLTQNVHLTSTPQFPPVPLSSQALSTLLDNFITIRNECAHTGQAANAPPSANDVLGCHASRRFVDS